MSIDDRRKTMAITALVKSSTLVLYPGEDVTKARVVEVSGAPTFSDSFDTIERDVVRQAFSTYAPLRGLETTSGTITVELHGSGVQESPPESTLLYKAAFGSLVGPAGSIANDWKLVDDELSVTALTDTVSEITWNDGTADQSFNPKLYEHIIEIDADPVPLGFKKHYPIRAIDANGKLLLVGFIIHGFSASDPDNPNGFDCLYVISENETPIDFANAVTVDCGFLYLLRNLDTSQVLELQDFTADYFRGDITKENWQKNLSTEFTIDFQTGQVVLPAFNFEGGGVGYGNEDQVDVPFLDVGDTLYWSGITDQPFDSSQTNPLIVQLADIYLENASETLTNESTRFYQECISGIQITLTNEVFKKECMASIGVGEVVRTSRSVTGSLDTFYTGLDFQEAFKQDTKYICRMVFNYAYQLNTTGGKDYNDTPGNIVAIAIPQLKFSEVNIEEDTGIFKYANSFACEPVEGDDEFILAFL